jgi:hypothetical protein
MIEKERIADVQNGHIVVDALVNDELEALIAFDYLQVRIGHLVALVCCCIIVIVII